MPKCDMGLRFDGWKDYMAKLDEIGGSDAMVRGVFAGLTSSQQYVAKQLEEKIQNLPAKGKYSTGVTKKSIIKDGEVWGSASYYYANVGFDFGESGTTSIFLMYGTPRMSPVKGLKAAVYGNNTNKKLKEIQEAEVMKVIKRIMGG